jgi:hypothetical protein
MESRIQTSEESRIHIRGQFSGIWNPQLIWNPESKMRNPECKKRNPESNEWNSESKKWNPESNEYMDYLTWADILVYIYSKQTDIFKATKIFFKDFFFSQTR